jgi:hypothetical protein
MALREIFRLRVSPLLCAGQIRAERQYGAELCFITAIPLVFDCQIFGGVFFRAVLFRASFFECAERYAVRFNQ